MTPAQTYRALQALARGMQRNTEELFILYGLERVLARLQTTRYRDDFVLKGGVLLAAYKLRRPTRDADMQVVDVTLDEEHMRAVLAAIAAAPADDGVTVELDSITVEAIRDEDEYSGLRVKFTARLHTAKLSLALDVSTGDPIYPAPTPVVLPGLLGQDVLLQGHPPTTVIAEKAITILQRGTQSTRWRDYVDLRSLARTRVFVADELLTAAQAVARHRHVVLGPVAPLVAGYGAIAQRKWAAWRRSQEMTDRCLEQLDEQMSELVTFIDPVFATRLPSNATWNPDRYVWD